MQEIIVSQPKNDSLSAQIIVLHKALKYVDLKQNLKFNLDQVKWSFPLLVLPLSAFILENNSYILTDNCDIKSYFDAIKFPKGIDSITEFQKVIQSAKSYIPISVLSKESKAEREKLESLFSSMVYKILDSQAAGVKNAIYYPISELVTNIFEHSQQNKGFIFGQMYPKKNYLDICIVDCGRGLQKTFKEEKELELSDEESVIEVMKGHSTKSSKERGYGVWTSKKIVCQGLKGNFVLISGSAVLISTSDKNYLGNLSDFYWQGVIIAYRIPKPVKSFDISPYLE